MIRAPQFEVLPLGEAGPILCGQERRRPLRELGRREHRLDRVVVARRNGIKFVVVAARALQRLSEEGLAHAVGHVVEEPLPRDLCNLHAGELPRPHPQETGRNHGLGVVRRELVPGDLLPDEAVEGAVGIEGPHHVIPVAPSVAAVVIVGEARGVRVAHDVEPVLRHPLPVVRAGEQPVNGRRDGRAGVGSVRLHEGRDRFG